MISFTASIQKFESQGEKTGWTYFVIPHDLAEALNPGVKKSFRVKGKLDAFAIKGVALVPMGEGRFIMALDGAKRKALKKGAGQTLSVKLEIDKADPPLVEEFLECLADEPGARKFFDTLPKGHQRYFSNWIESAKTETTKARRIAQAVTALSKGWGYGEMIRASKASKDKLL